MANGSERTQRARQKAFLAAFSKLGNITRACEETGVGRTTHYEWFKEDADYAERFGHAVDEASDRLEAEARRRAEVGYEEYVTSGGKLIRDEEGNPLLQRRFSDSLMILLLKAHKPDKYKDRKEVEHSGEIRTVQGLLSDVPEPEADA